MVVPWVLLGLVCVLATVASVAATPPTDDPIGDGEVRLTGVEDGRQVVMTEDQVLVLSLEANPSTGYQWEVVGIPERTLVRSDLDGPQYEAPSSKPGAVAYQLLRFRAPSAWVAALSRLPTAAPGSGMYRQRRRCRWRLKALGCSRAPTSRHPRHLPGQSRGLALNPTLTG